MEWAASHGMLRAVNPAKDALIISAVGPATTAFTGFSILRALKAWQWQLTSGTVLIGVIFRLGGALPLLLGRTKG